MKKAQRAAGREVETIAASYRDMGWGEAIASSGTAKSIAAILAANGWCDQGISASGLRRLKTQLLAAGNTSSLKLEGVRADRLPILPGGVAVMSAIFDTLELEHVDISDAALRQGVLYDLLGRVQHHDKRSVTVQQFLRRYEVDSLQQARVSALALHLYENLVPGAPDEDRQLLQWAAQLHEIGLSIAHAGYHKHSAYVLSNADMPGFSRNEQARLARVVLAHRGKLNKVSELPLDSAEWWLVLCLRLATLFHRSRLNVRMPSITCTVSERGFIIGLDKAWLDAHSLTAAALDDEIDEWRSIGIKFEVK